MIAVATETQTPIETIEKALVLAYRHVGCYEDSDFKTVPNARAALEDVEALVERAKDVMAIINESQGVVGFHLNGAIAEWSEFSWVEDLDTALAKFTVKATHDHAPGFPAHEHPDGEPPPRIVDSSQSS